MSTLMGAVELLNGRGQLPTNGTVSVRNLLQRFQPSPPGSVRVLLLKMFGSVAANRPWAVILCRFKGSPPDPALEGPIEQFYRGAFTPGTGGLVEYWRDASLGAIDITGSRVFDWVEVDITRAKGAVGRMELANAAIRAVQQRNGSNSLEGFFGQIAVYTQNWTKDGAPLRAQTGTGKRGVLSGSTAVPHLAK